MTIHGNDVSVEALFAQGTPEAATQLHDLAESTNNKETRKAARRALYLLSQKGIAPLAAAPSASADRAQEAASALRAWASAYDGAGNRLLFLALPNPEGGSPTLLQTLINDEEGVRDMDARRLSRRELAERLQGFKAQIEAGIALAEIEADYGRFLIQQARTLNQQNRRRTPAGFLDLLPLIGAPQQDYTQSPAWEALTPEAIQNDTAISTDPAGLFALRWFDAWFLDVNDVVPWLAPMQETLHRADLDTEAKQQIIHDTARQAADALLTRDLRARYARRLEESADILQRREHAAEARQALFHALQMRGTASSAEVPFAIVLVQRTMQAAIEMIRAQGDASPS